MPPCFPETNSSHFITMKLFNTKYYDYCGVTTQGITTYDYIIALREQEQEKKEVKDKRYKYSVCIRCTENQLSNTLTTLSKIN